MKTLEINTTVNMVEMNAQYMSTVLKPHRGFEIGEMVDVTINGLSDWAEIISFNQEYRQTETAKVKVFSDNGSFTFNVNIYDLNKIEV